MRRASRLPVGGAVAAVAADVLLTAARAALHFRETERTLKTAAPAMAELLYGLHKETGGYRVVAHSLGVRMAVEAISELLTLGRQRRTLRRRVHGVTSSPAAPRS